MRDEDEERRGALRSVIAEAGSDVQVVLVTKGFGVEALRFALSEGVAIGENYGQELLAKVGELTEEERNLLQVHFIGQLQRNKVKALSPMVDVWHTVDTTALVDELAKRAPGASVLVQVNLTHDEARGGCSFEAAPSMVKTAHDAGLKVLGLMTVGVPGDPEQSRLPFRRLRSMADDLGLHHLSAGMSNDYRIALEEGATIVRIGSAVLGKREYR